MRNDAKCIEMWCGLQKAIAINSQNKDLLINTHVHVRCVGGEKLWAVCATQNVTDLVMDNVRVVNSHYVPLLLAHVCAAQTKRNYEKFETHAGLLLQRLSLETTYKCKRDPKKPYFLHYVCLPWCLLHLSKPFHGFHLWSYEQSWAVWKHRHHTSPSVDADWAWSRFIIFGPCLKSSRQVLLPHVKQGNLRGFRRELEEIRKADVPQHVAMLTALWDLNTWMPRCSGGSCCKIWMYFLGI